MPSQTPNDVSSSTVAFPVQSKQETAWNSKINSYSHSLVRGYDTVLNKISKRIQPRHSVEYRLHPSFFKSNKTNRLMDAM